MSKHRQTRIVITALLLVLCMLFSAISVSAVKYSSAKMDKILKQWNNSSYSETNSTDNQYGGASQCAAFIRYAFDKLYDHSDHPDNENNTVSTFKCKTVSEALTHMKETAAPGDAFRISASKNPGSNTHIMLLSDIAKNGSLSIYHSNLDGETNQAKYVESTTMKRLLTKTMNEVVGVKKDGDTLTMTVTLRIIHSNKNECTSQNLTVNRYVKVTYDAGGGICSTKTRTLDKTKTFGTQPVPLCPGYMFSGWYTHASGGQKVDSDTLVSGQRTLYAHWIKCTHSVLELISEIFEGGICKYCGAEYPYEVIYQKAQIYKVTKEDGAVCRSRPYSENSDRICLKHKNAIVAVVGQTRNEHGNLWYLLSDGTWIYSGNVKKSSASNVYYVTKTDGYLILGKTASAKKPLDYMDEGSVVTVTKSKNSGSWYYVTYNGQSGYAHKSYLTTTAPEVRIVLSSLKTSMYAKADSDADIRTKIPAGSRYVVYTNRTAKNSDYYLAFWNGTAGYIKRSSAVVIE